MREFAETIGGFRDTYLGRQVVSRPGGPRAGIGSAGGLGALRAPLAGSGVDSAGLSSWGALCQTQMGAPVLCHSLVPIPAVPLSRQTVPKAQKKIPFGFAQNFV